MKKDKLLMIFWICTVLSLAGFGVLLGVGVKMNNLVYSIIGLLGVLTFIIGILILKIGNDD